MTPKIRQMTSLIHILDENGLYTCKNGLGTVEQSTWNFQGLFSGIARLGQVADTL